MKKLGLFCLAAMAAFTLSSCNESEGDYASGFSFGTLHTVGTTTSDYYFTSDTNKTLYPSDKSRVGACDVKDGERVIFSYNILKTPAEGYDYNIALYGVEKVGTGTTATVTTQEALDKLGKSKVTPYQWYPTTRNYFNMNLIYYASDKSKHSFTLVRNKIEGYKPEKTEDGYLNLELRHNDDGDTQGSVVYEWVSIPLTEFAEELKDMKGVIVCMTTHNDGVRYYKLDLTRE